MPPETTGELTCSVHLAATVKGLLKDGGAIFVIRELPKTPSSPVYYCTCRIEAEFILDNVGVDEDEPLPLFRAIR